MPKYLYQASYTVDGVRGLLKEGGSSRRANLDQVIKGVGGTIEALYFAFGDDDIIVIVDLPDEATAAALSLTISATGAVNLKTTPLITPETIDEASKKRIDYRPPGQ